MWMYQGVDLLYTGYCSHLGANIKAGKYTEQLDTDIRLLYIGYCSHLGTA